MKSQKTGEWAPGPRARRNMGTDVPRHQGPLPRTRRQIGPVRLLRFPTNASNGGTTCYRDPGLVLLPQSKGDRIAQLLFLPGPRQDPRGDRMGSTGQDSAYLIVGLQERPKLLLQVNGKSLKAF